MKLPSVTLVCIDCVNPAMGSDVLNICQRRIEFGSVKLLTHLPVESEYRIEIRPLTSLVMYSVFCLTELYKYIETEHLLIVQRDGWILNPASFKMEWLNLDYVAPLFMQYDRVGSGGFSLRSKRLMEYASTVFSSWDGTFEDAERIQYGECKMYEDGVLTMDRRFANFRIANLLQGADFAQGGNRNPHYFRERPFGFHRTWQQIDFNTAVVDSTDLSRDITQSYEDDIKKLANI